MYRLSSPLGWRCNEGTGKGRNAPGQGHWKRNALPCSFSERLGWTQQLAPFSWGFSQPFIHIYLIPWQKVLLMNDFNLFSCLWFSLPKGIQLPPLSPLSCRQPVSPHLSAGHLLLHKRLLSTAELDTHPPSVGPGAPSWPTEEAVSTKRQFQGRGTVPEH